MKLSKSEIRKELRRNQRLLSKSPRNTRFYMKIGDLYMKLGKKEKAIKNYRSAMDIFLEDGHPLGAISAAKIILKIDPELKDVAELAVDLYTRIGHTKEANLAIEQFKLKRPLLHLLDEESEDPLEIVKKKKGFERFKVIFDTVPLLSKIFRELSESDYIHLSENISFADYGEDEYIYHQGEIGEVLFIILNGQVRIIKRHPSGNEFIVSRLKTGDFFGESSYLFDTPRKYSIQAETETRVLQISKSVIEEMSAEHPLIKRIIRKLLKELIMEKLIPSVPIFCDMEETNLSNLLTRFDLGFYKAGSHIYSRGDTGNFLYILKEGTAAVIKEKQYVQSEIETLLTQGDFFGNIDSVKNLPPVFSVFAHTNCEIAKLSKKNYDIIKLTNPALEQELHKFKNRSQR